MPCYVKCSTRMHCSQSWRDVYTLSSLIKASADLHSQPDVTEDTLTKSMRQLDMGIMMGGPVFRPLLDRSMGCMEARGRQHSVSGPQSSPESEPTSKKQKLGEALDIEPPNEQHRSMEEGLKGSSISRWKDLIPKAKSLPPRSLLQGGDRASRPVVMHLPR